MNRRGALGGSGTLPFLRRRKFTVLALGVSLLAGVSLLLLTSSASGSPSPGPPPAVSDSHGRPLQVGSVVATLTPVPGGCAGTSGVHISASGKNTADVTARLDSHCREVVTAIDVHPANQVDTPDTSNSGEFFAPSPGASGQ